MEDDDLTPSRDAMFTSVAQSITAFGLLAIAGLLVSGLVFTNLAVVLCALTSCAASYVAMYATMMALTNPRSLGAYRIAMMVNPTMTLMAAVFWLLGVFQLWG